MIENIYLVKFYDKDTDEVLGGLLITLNGGGTPCGLWVLWNYF